MNDYNSENSEDKFEINDEFLKPIKNNYKFISFIDCFTKEPLIKLTGSTILVGSSGRVLLKENGDIINEFDNIIRMNTAPQQKFEKFVGNRTDIRVIAFNALIQRLSRKT